MSSSMQTAAPVCASALAKAWGKAPATVTGWILNGVRRGKQRKYLRAFKLGRQWLVTPEAVADFLAACQPGGRAGQKAKARQAEKQAGEDLAEVRAFLGMG